MGARRSVLVKDGLYTEDVKKNPKTRLIREITAPELLEAHMEDVVVERKLVELLPYATNAKEAYVVNEHKPGNVEKAIDGENAGTVIRA